MAVEFDEGGVGCFNEAEIGVDPALAIEPEGVGAGSWF